MTATTTAAAAAIETATFHTVRCEARRRFHDAVGRHPPFWGAMIGLVLLCGALYAGYRLWLRALRRSEP